MHSLVLDCSIKSHIIDSTTDFVTDSRVDDDVTSSLVIIDAVVADGFSGEGYRAFIDDDASMMKATPSFFRDIL